MPARAPSDVPARSDVACAPSQAASPTPKTGTTPVMVTEPATDLEGGRGDDPEVDVALNEVTGLETGPAVEGLTDGDIEVQETTMDAHGADAPSGPRAKDLVWDKKESQALRQDRKDAERTPSTDSVGTYLRQIG